MSIDLQEACQKKKKKKKEEETMCRRKKEKRKSNVDKPMCNCTWAFLSKNDVQFFSSIFSPFQRENFLMGPERKYLSPTIYFPSFPPNQTHSEKFFFLFSLQCYTIHPIPPPNKHTLRAIPRYLPLTILIHIHNQSFP